jgi:hypothetical protein
MSSLKFRLKFFRTDHAEDQIDDQAYRNDADEYIFHRE